MKKFSTDKNINEEVRMLIRQGWTLSSGKKHRAIMSPDGIKMAIPCTPSDRRAYYNFRRDVRSIVNRGVHHAA